MQLHENQVKYVKKSVIYQICDEVHIIFHISFIILGTRFFIDPDSTLQDIIQHQGNQIRERTRRYIFWGRRFDKLFICFYVAFRCFSMDFI